MGDVMGDTRYGEYVMCSTPIVIFVVASAIGVYLHGAWNLVDQAVCGVIVAVPWLIASSGGSGAAMVFGCLATYAAVTAAALLPAWSTEAWSAEGVIVFGLALASVPVAIIGPSLMRGIH